MYRFRVDGLFGSLTGVVLAAMIVFGVIFIANFSKDVYQLGFHTAKKMHLILGIGLIVGGVTLLIISSIVLVN